MQGNCGDCRIPKVQMDNIDDKFPARIGNDMVNAIDEAFHKGIYEDWEKDLTRKAIRKDNKAGKSCKKPLPLLNKDGKISKTRAKKAATRLGRHLQVTFFDAMKNLDLHNRVSVTTYCTVMIFLSRLTCT